MDKRVIGLLITSSVHDYEWFYVNNKFITNSYINTIVGLPELVIEYKVTKLIRIELPSWAENSFYIDGFPALPLQFTNDEWLKLIGEYETPEDHVVNHIVRTAREEIDDALSGYSHSHNTTAMRTMYLVLQALNRIDLWEKGTAQARKKYGDEGAFHVVESMWKYAKEDR